jgi:hypothetical protein
MAAERPDVPARDCELVRREIQEIREALEAFRTAVEAGEMAGFQDGGIRSHGGFLIARCSGFSGRFSLPQCLVSASPLRSGLGLAGLPKRKGLA